MSRKPLARDDAGFTLVEVLVTLVIGMVVLFAALLTMEQGFTSSAKVQDRHDSAGRARLTLDRAVTLLQAQVCNGPVVPITSATATSVVFTANTGAADAVARQYELKYEASAGGGQFVESSRALDAPDGTGYRAPVGASTTRVIVDRVVPETASAPVFAFYGTDSSSTGDPVPLDVSTAAGRARILRVDISLRALPTRTKTLDDRTSSLISSSAYLTSHVDPAKLDKGPQC